MDTRMSTLLEKPIKVSRTITTSLNHARAIEDPARARMLVILYHKALSADQISQELKKSGYKKALTTIRHHLDILKGSGLIEVVRIEETRGAVTKFYGTSTRLLDYDVPEDFDARYSKQIQNAAGKIEKILRSITPKAATKSKGSKGSKGSGDGYSQYLALEIMNRAVTNVLENPRSGTAPGKA